MEHKLIIPFNMMPIDITNELSATLPESNSIQSSPHLYDFLISASEAFLETPNISYNLLSAMFLKLVEISTSWINSKPASQRKKSQCIKKKDFYQVYNHENAIDFEGRQPCVSFIGNQRENDRK